MFWLHTRSYGCLLLAAPPKLTNRALSLAGSNGVNVFLGCGIPWLIASVYQSSRGATYVMRTPAIARLVIAYVAFAAVALGAFQINRGRGGELGGTASTRFVMPMLLISMWAAYVVIAATAE
jgi:solute carrier family 8 (sodium/calcium exchanger)